MKRSSEKTMPAKKCFTHIGGTLGRLLLENFIDKGWLSPTKGSKHYHLTAKGKAGLTRLGVDISQIKLEPILNDSVNARTSTHKRSAASLHR